MLGTIFVVTPTVGWAFPLLWPILLSTAGALGFKLYTSTADDAPLRGKLSKQLRNLRTVTLRLDELVQGIAAEEVGRDQVVRFVKDDIVLVFRRDPRGKFSIEVMGPAAKSARELEAIGREFAFTLIQQFAYNRMVQEMERRGATLASEEVNENGDIVLRLRHWK
ncbi:MAG: hypothetical protein N2644_10935 [Candidatus Sumerlaea chitinivorans]|uniref:DUF1257 domain-containing protein n=1 Tax=Sumerlaea chitinivorans TaxID=2250252 RepID=A0A2Z4Y8F6_SUMC1|nr:hypothetical protein BRCON_2792 [Candidatus Sumerlaea chitinivorans]MCX7964972.1 hypothetical protein [Candidatus Sumerlaea chitinivorans]